MSTPALATVFHDGMTLLRMVREQPSASPLERRTDDDLMTLAQSGARAAFATLVERHAVRVMQSCSRFAGDPDVTADLAQEVWVTIWTRRSQYRCDGKFLVWLITVTRNHCRNHLRSRGALRRHVEAAAVDETSSPEQIDALLVQERRRSVRNALGRLPEPMREALVLRYGEELRYDQMAEVVRAGESTLRSRVHHGLRLLRSLLEKDR